MISRSNLLSHGKLIFSFSCDNLYFNSLITDFFLCVLLRKGICQSAVSFLINQGPKLSGDKLPFNIHLVPTHPLPECNEPSSEPSFDVPDCQPMDHIMYLGFPGRLPSSSPISRYIWMENKCL